MLRGYLGTDNSSESPGGSGPARLAPLTVPRPLEVDFAYGSEVPDAAVLDCDADLGTPGLNEPFGRMASEEPLRAPVAFNVAPLE